jgi:hypothetical protein
MFSFGFKKNNIYIFKMSSKEVIEDFLEVDQSIPGQNFVCLSFISPEKIIKKREAVLVKEFAKYFLKDLKNEKDPSKLDPEKFTPEFIDTLNIYEKYEDFLYAHEEELTKKYNDENDFQTSIRGLKIRGVYESRREAEVRAKVLQRRDPNFHVFVGQVGYWLPWDPNPDNIGEQEYANEQLNTLMKKYQENRSHRDEIYAAETEDRKKKAREENQKRKFYQQKTDEDDKDAEEKIRELRDIVDEKDRLFEKMNLDSAAGAAGAAGPAGGVADAGPAPGSLMAGLNDAQHADPWMARKTAAADGKNFEAGGAKEEPTAAEKDGILKSIMKSIF